MIFNSKLVEEGGVECCLCSTVSFYYNSDIVPTIIIIVCGPSLKLPGRKLIRNEESQALPRFIESVFAFLKDSPVYLCTH